MNVRCARRYQIFFLIISRLACQWLSTYPFERDLRVLSYLSIWKLMRELERTFHRGLLKSSG